MTPKVEPAQDASVSSPWTPARMIGAGVLDWCIANLAAAVAYFALGLIVSRFFAAYGLFPAPIWLPAGVGRFNHEGYRRNRQLDSSAERVFRPFERVQSGLAHKIEGTGLGLSIARGLMLLHGGNIILESSVGEGTTAIVTIPSNRVVTMQVATKSRLAGAPQTAFSA